MTYRLFIGQGLDAGLKRQQNEDAIAHQYPENFDAYQKYGALFALADGVGGLSSGVLASESAVKGLLERYYFYAKSSKKTSLEQIQDALTQINQQIHNAYENSATTIVAALIQGKVLTIAHVGDSRAYLYKNKYLEQLTQDHVYPVEQADGRVKNKLLKALGYKENIELEIHQYPLEENNRLLLLSDGATRYLDNTKLASLCQEYSNPQALAQAIIDSSNSSGGIDNISVFVVDIGKPLNNQADFQKHSPLVYQPSKNSSSKTASKNRVALSFILALLVFCIVAYLIWTQKNPKSQTISPSPIVLPSETPLEIIASATATNEPVPTATVTNTPEPILEVGVALRFDDTAATYVRIQEDVISFVLEPNQRYQIDDVFETAEGIKWYRLYDERDESYGWISEANLPPYTFIF